MVVMSYDIFAYFSGILFGKRHLAPTISPNKTWEGTLIGGSISLILTVSLLVSYGANTTIHSDIINDGLQSSFFGAQLGISHSISSG
jgi:phosphatidate cytidylyltransferase